MRLDISGAISASANAVRDFIGGAVEMAAKAEKNRVIFKVLVGDVRKTTILMEKLGQVAKDTPLGKEEIEGAARQLLAFKGTTETVVPTLKRLGDIAAGTGISLNDLAEIYGKARVQGTLFAEDINQLTGRGIDVISEFAKQLGVGADKVKKLASEGKVGFANLEKAFVAMTSKGGKFNGILEKQNTTLGAIIDKEKQRRAANQLKLGKSWRRK